MGLCGLGGRCMVGVMWGVWWWVVGWVEGGFMDYVLFVCCCM